jgi:phosphatidylinositol glycan class B
MFAGVYMVADKVTMLLSVVPQMRATILVLIPKILQGICAALGDYFTWKFAERVYGRDSNVAWTTVCSISIVLLHPVAEHRLIHCSCT